MSSLISHAKRIAGLSYSELNSLLQNEKLPLFLVDLDALDRNIERLRSKVETYGKKMRIATKSIRVPELISRVMKKGGPSFQGLLCYSIHEAQMLVDLGYDDLVVAYPFTQSTDLTAFFSLVQHGKQVTAMVDCPEHVQIIDEYAVAQGFSGRARVAIDIDLSFRKWGLHLGVQRSPVRDLSSFKQVFETIRASRSLIFDGVMGYEAQIAGVTDQSPFKAWMNPLKKKFKALSVDDTYEKRKSIAMFLKENESLPRFFNGGGTGSLATTLTEPWLTEVTAGSGFLQSHLFDYYASNENEPASYFALRVTRKPEPEVLTCQSGGFIASGETGLDRSPVVFMPAGLAPISTEGFGEVQTPLRGGDARTVKMGDSVFFRSAKAGEIAEHFDEYALLSQGKIVSRAKTYRGSGWAFY